MLVYPVQLRLFGVFCVLHHQEIKQACPNIYIYKLKYLTCMLRMSYIAV